MLIINSLMHTNKTKSTLRPPTHPIFFRMTWANKGRSEIEFRCLFLLIHTFARSSILSFLVLVFITTYQDYLGQMKNPIDLKWKAIHNKVQRIQIEQSSHKNIIVFGVFWISFDSFYQMSWRVSKKAHWIGYAMVMVVWFMIFLVFFKKREKLTDSSSNRSWSDTSWWISIVI